MATTAPRPEAESRAEGPPPGDRFVAGGLLALLVLSVFIQVIAGVVIPPLAVPALIYLALGLAVWRRGSRWLLILAAVLPVLHVVTSIPFLVEAMAHPETPVTFLPDTFIVIVAVTVAAGAVAGLRGGRPEVRRRIAAVAGVVAGAAVVVSVVAAAGVDSEARQPGDVVVESVATTYPDRVQVPEDGAVLWVDNQDPYRHTLVIEGTDVRVEVPGSTAVRVPADLEPGTHRYYCDVPGHESMEGVLDVG